jgi:hypothetical protein
MQRLFSICLGVTFLIVVLAAVVSLIYYAQVPLETDLSMPVHKQPLELTYADPMHDYQIGYEDNYAILHDGAQENFFRTHGQTLSTVVITTPFFPNTNFAEGQATVAVRPETSPEDCSFYTVGAAAPATMTQQSQVAGHPAYYAEFSDAAAGTAYSTRLYHVPHNGDCYEISLTVGLSNIDNFDPDTVRQLQPADVWPRLNRVLTSFKFIN